MRRARALHTSLFIRGPVSVYFNNTRAGALASYNETIHRVALFPLAGSSGLTTAGQKQRNSQRILSMGAKERRFSENAIFYMHARQVSGCQGAYCTQHVIPDRGI